MKLILFLSVTCEKQVEWCKKKGLNGPESGCPTIDYAKTLETSDQRKKMLIFSGDCDALITSGT